MQASLEETERASPDFGLGSDFAEIAAKVSDEFTGMMRVNDLDETPEFLEEVGEDEYEDEDDEEFSFASVGTFESTSSADDMFHNGQIKPVFPLFDQSLLFAEDSLPPTVKKVFVEARDSSPPPETAEEGEVAGPYCEWSRKAVEVSSELSKKSNSTGFSKFWRFRETGSRSNSNGRDAFVFLNGASSSTTSTSTTSKRGEKLEKSQAIPEERSVGEAKAMVGSTGGKAAAAGKGKRTSSSSSAHEKHYVRSRALREEDRRRSYLPYRPGLVGFFTNVQGGLSRNVHPF